jgi:hypothetical protein
MERAPFTDVNRHDSLRWTPIVRQPVLLLRHRRFLGARLHLSQLSHFPGPAHGTRRDTDDTKAPVVRHLSDTEGT